MKAGPAAQAFANVAHPAQVVAVIQRQAASMAHHLRGLRCVAQAQQRSQLIEGRPGDRRLVPLRDLRRTRAAEKGAEKHSPAWRPFSQDASTPLAA